MPAVIKENYSLIKDLFTLGRLTLRSAEWYRNRGISVKCEAGEVHTVIPAEVELWEDVCREALAKDA